MPEMTTPGMDVVRELIPAPIRKAIYATYVLAGVVLGAISAGFEFAGDAPSWVGVALAVMAYLAVPLALLAAVNTSPNAEPTTEAEPRHLAE